MKKNNKFNWAFHHTQIKENQKCANIDRAWIPQLEQYITAVLIATSLEELLAIHKDMFKHGYVNKNLAPDIFGMFRTRSIQDMTLDEVYLGGIFGIFTKPASWFIYNQDEPYGVNGFGLKKDTKLYDLVFNQYQNILVSNLRADLKWHEDDLAGLERLGY